jgi:2,5-diketo-D-gluconate reductase B
VSAASAGDGGPLLMVQNMRMPKLGFGTWRLRGEECRRAVASALDLGYRHIDTARMYDNEAEVGEALSASAVPRQNIHVTSKVWHTELAPDAIERAVHTSLRLLRTDYLDLYLIHWPAPDMDLPAALGALLRLRERGLLRAVGVSNFTVALLRQAVEQIGAPIACNQVEYHVGLSQEPVLTYARAYDMAVAAYRPLGGGGLAEHPVLQTIARKHGASPAQVALKWLLDQDGVAAIPKAARPENQRQNLDALRLVLDDADRTAIARMPKAGRLVDPGWAPAWDS